MKRLFTRPRLIAAGVALAVVAGISIWLAWADLFRTHLVNFAHESFYVVAPLLLWIALIGSAVLVIRAGGTRNLSRPRDYDFDYTDVGRQAYKAACEKYEARKARAQEIRRTTNVVGGLLALAAVVAVGFTIKFWVMHSYNVDKQYDAGLRVVKADMPTYAQRGAQPVADASAKSNLGDVVGTLDAVRFVANGSTDSWNALVERKATFGGYAAVEVQHVALTGSSSATDCTFSSNANRRIGGSFTHSLERAIAAVHSGAKINDGDVYGYCQAADHPMVVVPLTKQVGWLYSHEVPAGVAVYDGKTGQVTYYAHVAAGQLPGPVYPISLATKQREASAAVGSFADYWHNRTGYEDTSSDANDPNGDNRAEFSLRKAAGGSSFVTPLTERGASTSIAAVGVLDNDAVTAGSYAPFVVHTLAKPRSANSTVAQHIRGDYGDMPEWAAHMEIFEITPVGPDTWVASLGQNQDINYRVLVKADGSSCLQRADGSTIRCGKVTGTNGNGVGVALAPGATGPVPVPADGRLSALSNAQLLQLQQQITTELGSRLSSK